MKRITGVMLLVGLFALWGCGHSGSHARSGNGGAPSSGAGSGEPGDSTVGGSISSPVVLAVNAAHNGDVGQSLEAFYSVATTSGHQYTISLTDVTGDPDLYVFSDSGYTSLACSSTNTGAVNETCSTVATGQYTYIRVDGYKTDSTYTLTISDTTSIVTPGSEGTVTSPVSVNSGYTGKVNYGSYSYYDFAATAGNVYKITISNMSADADLKVFNTDSTFTTFACTSLNSGTSNETCTITASAGMVYFSIYAASGSTNFTVTIAQTSAIPSQGSQASPVSISGGYSGSVGASGQSSYYTVPVTAGSNVTVSLTGLSNGVTLKVYSDPSLATLICSSTGTSTTDASCSGIATGSAVYIVTTGNASTGANYTINVSQAVPPAPTNEGSSASPVAVSSGSSGSVAASGQSYYTMPVTAGDFVTVTLTGSGAGATLKVYSDPGLNTLICSSTGTSTSDASCSGIAPGSAIYVVATGGSSAGANYTINVSQTLPPAPTSEGSSTSPVTVSSGYSGSVAASGQSYYTVRVTAGDSITVTLAGSGAGTALNVYSDPGLTTLICNSTGTSTSDASCSGVATGTAVYVVASGSASTGAIYTIDVSQTAPSAPANEGSSTSPVAVSSGYSGSVAASGQSYYTIPVTAGDTITVTLTGSGAGTTLNVYSDPGLTLLICSSTGTSTSDAGCSGIAPGSTVYVVASGSSSAGASYTLNVSQTVPPTPTNEGTTASPVVVSSGYSGSVAASGQSYYTVPVTAGDFVTVSLADGGAGTTLNVYSDPGLTTLICSNTGTATTNATCGGIAPGSAIYIVATGNSSMGASYILNVSQSTPPSDEGSESSPDDVSSSKSGEVADGGSSYYSFATTPGTRYTTTISDLSNDIDLHVYNDDSSYSTPVCDSIHRTTEGETCTFTATGNAAYFNTDSHSGASHYRIRIEH